MKLLAINASLRGEQGHTAYLIGKIFEGASSKGAYCESITLSRHKINRCLGCNKCQGQEHYLKCIQEDKDDVKMIFNKIEVTDVVIYATPVYVFGISSLLKTLIERMYGTSDCSDLRLSKSGLVFHHINPRISSKPFVTLICCDNMENATPANAVSYFRTYASFMDAPQVGSLIRNGGTMAGHGKDPARQEIFPRLKESYDAFVCAGQELATQGRINRKTQKTANQEIVPLPMFHILKNIRPFKKVIVKKARMLIKPALPREH